MVQQRIRPRALSLAQALLLAAVPTGALGLGFAPGRGVLPAVAPCSGLRQS